MPRSSQRRAGSVLSLASASRRTSSCSRKGFAHLVATTSGGIEEVAVHYDVVFGAVAERQEQPAMARVRSTTMARVRSTAMARVRSMATVQRCRSTSVAERPRAEQSAMARARAQGRRVRTAAACARAGFSSEVLCFFNHRAAVPSSIRRRRLGAG